VQLLTEMTTEEVEVYAFQFKIRGCHVYKEIGILLLCVNNSRDISRSKSFTNFEKFTKAGPTKLTYCTVCMLSILFQL
jgi:hypothetical protein